MLSNLDIEYEFKIQQSLGRVVVGVDEVGRGSWAGPLVLCGYAIISNLNKYKHKYQLLGANDSKLLSRKKRQKFYGLLENEVSQNLSKIFLVKRSAVFISEYGLAAAVNEALRELVVKASAELKQKVFFAFDGSLLPTATDVYHETIIKGDSKIYSIACASIYAKVYRDNYMQELAVKVPGYGFSTNVGYGTFEHRQGLEIHGISKYHRTNYKPIADLIHRKQLEQNTENSV